MDRVVRTMIWICPTGSRPDGERESGGLLDCVKVYVLPINVKSNCPCWTENCCLFFLYFREPVQEERAVSIS